MFNHYEQQKLAEFKEEALRKRAAEQWMYEKEIQAADAKPKGLLKRIRTALAAIFA